MDRGHRAWLPWATHRFSIYRHPGATTTMSERAPHAIDAPGTRICMSCNRFETARLDTVSPSPPVHSASNRCKARHLAGTRDVAIMGDACVAGQFLRAALENAQGLRITPVIVGALIRCGTNYRPLTSPRTTAVSISYKMQHNSMRDTIIGSAVAPLMLPSRASTSPKHLLASMIRSFAPRAYLPFPAQRSNTRSTYRRHRGRLGSVDRGPGGPTDDRYHFS